MKAFTCVSAQMLHNAGLVHRAHVQPALPRQLPELPLPVRQQQTLTETARRIPPARLFVFIFMADGLRNSWKSMVPEASESMRAKVLNLKEAYIKLAIAS